MEKKKCIFLALAVVLLSLVAAMPSAATDSDVSDIALTPGADASQLNITWHAGDAVAGETCSVEVTKNPFKMRRFHWFFSRFPGFKRTFDGTWVDAGLDEYGDSCAYCKVTVDGLKNWEKYTYRVSDGTGDWSDSYKYTPSNHKKYGFLFVSDPQIGAGGDKDLSKSRDIEPAVKGYYEDAILPDIDPDLMFAYLKVETDLAEDYLDGAGYIEDEIPELIAAYLDGTGDEALAAQIDAYLWTFVTDHDYTVDYVYDELIYDEYVAEGRETDLAALKEIDEGLQQVLLDMIADRIDEQMIASAEDADGWVTTVDLMTAMYPRASFIISGGDQVELKNAEWEYTGLFAAEQLTSIPMAPTYASHDRALNFEYHFNLPNESTDYGVDEYGVGDYYFTHGDTLVMVLNMDVTNNLFPRGAPPGPPPGGGGPPGTSTDSDGDGVSDDDDMCLNTPEGIFVDENGCSLVDGEDYDGDGVLNENDLCSNTLSAHYDLIGSDGCPVEDIDEDGIPDVDVDGVTIDRCNNTYGDLTVDEDGCAECDYLETDDELRAWLAEKETNGELDEFIASMAEHQAFMAETIEANPKAKWKIVVWHYSIYSAAMHSTDDNSEGIRYYITPMLEDLDVDVVLMGHDHAYTRTHQMLGNEPQLDQIVGRRGQVINPTGVLYLTASSSSGSKYYELNCNLDHPTSDSAVYYNYVATYDEYIPTFTYFEVNHNTLKLSSYTYLEVEDDEKIGTGEYEVTLIDEYAIQKKPNVWKDRKQEKWNWK